MKQGSFFSSRLEGKHVLRHCQTKSDPRGFFAVRFVVLSCLMASVVFAARESRGQDTPEYFRQNCLNCHTIGGGRLTGPDLKDVLKRRDDDWLINFMMDPNSVIDSGDAYAIDLLEKSNNVRMPKLPGLDRERAENLLKLIEAESKLETSQFKGLQISNKPFSDADRALGRDIFVGRVALNNGGTSCISCHSMYDTPALGGGRLGPDLTNVYERLKGRKSISAWLYKPSTKTMRPIFEKHQMTGEEINALAAYFESSAGERESEPSTNRVALLLIGLVGAAALIFGFDAIWKRRFHSVRKPLVDTNAIRGNR